MTAPGPADLESRLRIYEDKLTSYELIASHLPSADKGHADYTSFVYNESDVLDCGPTLDCAKGAKKIAAFIQRMEHGDAIRGGLTHFGGLPLVALRGEAAVMTSYLLIVHLDHDGSRATCPITAHRRGTGSIGLS